MRTFIVAVALFLASPTAAYTIIDDSGSALQKLDAALSLVADQFVDPVSVQFRHLTKGHSETVVCGEVNAKNLAGGYAGFSPFVADADGGYLRLDATKATLQSTCY